MKKGNPVTPTTPTTTAGHESHQRQEDKGQAAREKRKAPTGHRESIKSLGRGNLYAVDDVPDGVRDFRRQENADLGHVDGPQGGLPSHQQRYAAVRHPHSDDGPGLLVVEEDSHDYTPQHLASVSGEGA